MPAASDEAETVVLSANGRRVTGFRPEDQCAAPELHGAAPETKYRLRRAARTFIAYRRWITPMIDVFFLVPIAIGLGLGGPASFMWTLKNGQYDDLEGAAQRILFEGDDGPDCQDG